MKYARKVDDNQQEIVKALMGIGCSVADTSRAGEGFPDLVVAHRNHGTCLIEVKDGNKSPSRRKLTESQVRFHNKWKGEIHIVTNVDEALAIFGAK